MELVALSDLQVGLLHESDDGIVWSLREFYCTNGESETNT